MAFGFAAPYLSHLGPIAQRAMASRPAPAQVQLPAYAASAAGLGFPPLPQAAGARPAAPRPAAPTQQASPAPAQTAPVAPPPGGGMPSVPPATEMPAETAAGDGGDIGELIAAIFGG